MIFSFSENRNELIISPHEKLDVFCFFHVEHSIITPEELWFPAICASLRMKHEVLILEKDVTAFPLWDTSKRWEVGDQWCWIAPRALSSLQQFYAENPGTYEFMKNRLSRSK